MATLELDAGEFVYVVDTKWVPLSKGSQNRRRVTMLGRDVVLWRPFGGLEFLEASRDPVVIAQHFSIPLTACILTGRFAIPQILFVVLSLCVEGDSAAQLLTLLNWDRILRRHCTTQSVLSNVAQPCLEALLIFQLVCVGIDIWRAPWGLIGSLTYTLHCCQASPNLRPSFS
jgi:hypothetical protein